MYQTPDFAVLLEHASGDLLAARHPPILDHSFLVSAGLGVRSTVMARSLRANHSRSALLLHGMLRGISTPAPIALVAVVHFVATFTASGAESARRPNIVWIMADDND
jgi:hypothetical protein